MKFSAAIFPPSGISVVFAHRMIPVNATIAASCARWHPSGVIPKSRVFTSGMRDLRAHTAALFKLTHYLLRRFAAINPWPM
jgi:hypothetical protein